VIARFHRLLNEDVYFLTGTDENAQKNVISAKTHNIPVQSWVNAKSTEFQQLLQALDISNTDFIRTSDQSRHWKGVHVIWTRVFNKGDIYKQTYHGQYCMGCEAFLTEPDLIQGCCPEHLTPPEHIDEVNYFFRLSRYQNQLESLIASDIVQIIPVSRKNEVLAFIREGLQDFSISRPTDRLKGWGIPVPNDSTQLIYVWFDALVNYISALGFGTSDDSVFCRFWAADLHVIGKGIVRFHAIYWLAMLLSAGISLPKTIFVHGYITVENQKMSKSLGNVIDPLTLVHTYGLEAVRYALLSTISPFNDGNFSEQLLIDRNNQDLVGILGNFCYRTLSFIDRYVDGFIPPHQDFDLTDQKLLQQISIVSERLYNFLNQFKIRDALQEIMALAGAGNKYFQEKTPWKLIQIDKKQTFNTLYVCAEVCRCISILIYPFVPHLGTTIWTQLGLTEPLEQQRWAEFQTKQLKFGMKILHPFIMIQKIT
jgi:methionyl-tRNA synthetase